MKFHSAMYWEKLLHVITVSEQKLREKSPSRESNPWPLQTTRAPFLRLEGLVLRIVQPLRKSLESDVLVNISIILPLWRSPVLYPRQTFLHYLARSLYNCYRFHHCNRTSPRWRYQQSRKLAPKQIRRWKSSEIFQSIFLPGHAECKTIVSPPTNSRWYREDFGIDSQHRHFSSNFRLLTATISTNGRMFRSICNGVSPP